MPTTTDEAGGVAARAPRDTARFFHNMANLYDQFTRVLDAPETPVNRWLDEHVGSGHRALDIGCGVGRHSVMLADRYDDVTGIDAAPAMIEIAERKRSRPNIRYQIRDMLSLTPERDGRFDLVTAIGCASLAGPPELVLGHLRRLVANGGTLLVMEPMWDPRWGSQEWRVEHAFRAARATWEATGDPDNAAIALQLLLNPMLHEAAKISIPVAREDFYREYSAALPGVKIDEGLDLIGIGSGVEFVAASWRAENG